MRPIDADELLTAFPVDDEPMLTKSSVRMTIRRMPTIKPPAQPVQRWIPCSERLPEENERVLICGVKGGLAIAKKGTVLGIDTFWANGTKIIEAVAWMPLPEPYKGGEQDG